MEFTDERLLKLRRALQARADELAASQGAGASPMVPVAAAVPEPVETGTLPSPTRGAVPTADREVAASLRQGPVEGAAKESAPPAKPALVDPLEPKSVSYDFETGIKTTVFENSVVREPFDVAALKGMTGRLPPLR